MRERLKIGIYTPQYPGISGAGGIGTYTRSLATAMHELGQEVHVLTVADPRAGKKDEQLEGVHIHRIEPGYLPIVERWAPGARAAWQISQRARNLVKDYALDIFEFPNWEGAGRFFKVAVSPPAVPMVVRMHTSLSEIHEIEEVTPGWGGRFACSLENDQCRTADSLYVSTQAHRARMADELKLDASRIHILPLGVPDVSIPAAHQPRSRSSTPTLLYLGRLEKRKGILDLLQAMPEIAEKIPNVRLVLIGNDRPHAPGKKTHREYFSSAFPAALQKHVLFAGFLSDSEVDEWFERADAFVAPSIYESFGLIFIEAMRWSLPVIGTYAGGIPEIVDDGVNGFLVQKQSPDQIAQAAIRLLSDEPLRLKMGTAARNTYVNKFSNRVMARRTIEYYRGVIENFGSLREGRLQCAMTPDE